MDAGKIGWLRGEVIKTEAVFQVAEEYLLYCHWCQGGLCTRRSSLVRHVRSCGLPRTLEEATDIVEGWMAEGDEVEQEALNMLIARICELEGKSMRGRI